MKVHNSELISGLIDGELQGLRRWLVQRHVGRCVACAAEYRHLQHVRQMLTENPVTPAMSDSPDFFWSKVKREIQAQAGQTATVPVPHLSPADWFGSRWYAFASAAAVVVAVLGVGLVLRVHRSPPAPLANVVAAVPLATVEHVATTLPDTAATAFTEKDAGVTVIWVSGLPWTKTMKDMETLYATL